jgi:hypothetical protein
VPISHAIGCVRPSTHARMHTCLSLTTTNKTRSASNKYTAGKSYPFRKPRGERLARDRSRVPLVLILIRLIGYMCPFSLVG